MITPGDCFAEDFASACCLGEASIAASKSGIQRINGVRSATSVMYQSFLAASQRAPNALTASFSANGVTKLILMEELSRWSDDCQSDLFTTAPHAMRVTQGLGQSHQTASATITLVRLLTFLAAAALIAALIFSPTAFATGGGNALPTCR